MRAAFASEPGPSPRLRLSLSESQVQMMRERLAEGEELGSDRLRVARSSLWFREATRAQDLLGRALDPPVRPRNGCNGPNRRCRAAARH
jgi:hypothetical protein